jgi:diguanylate cyclase (GGDEF)-like protein
LEANVKTITNQACDGTAPAGENETRRLATLHDYGVLDVGQEQHFEDITMLAAHLCAAPIAFVGLVDDRHTFVKAAVGIAAAEASLMDGYCRHAIRQRGVFEVRDTQLDERFRDHPLVTAQSPVRFLAAVPLITPSGHAVGALCVADFEPRQLSIEQHGALQILARQVVAMLELGMLQFRDPLTGLGNRRCLTDALEREMRRATRRRSRVGLVQIDIDDFRRVNVTHGHEAGDAALRAVGAVLTRKVRKEDVVCRVGADEFLIVMSDAVVDVVAARAETLRQGIHALELPLPNEETNRLTGSIGIAAYPEHGNAPAKVLAEADHALRLAKTGGRNRVVVAPWGLDFRMTLADGEAPARA